MISVVLATYNSMRFIKKQLDSIINQTVQVDEVIIVDDCSSDSTTEYIGEYITSNHLSNWKLFQHEINKGYIKTFRDALSYANGDIIITCDHDDIWLSTKVEMILNTFDNNPSVLYLATSFIQIDENDIEIGIKKKRNRANNNLIRRSVNEGVLNKMLLDDVAFYNIAPGCTCAIRDSIKSVFLEIENLKVLPHDWSLALIAANNDGLYYLDLPTTKYRIYSNNTIGLGHERRYQARLKIVKRNVLEKQDMIKILKYINASSDTLMMFQDVETLFKKRERYIEQRNVVGLLKLGVQSIHYGTIYESIAYDIYSVIKGDKGL